MNAFIYASLGALSFLVWSYLIPVKLWIEITSDPSIIVLAFTIVFGYAAAVARR